jgi:RNA polymerase sigma factor (sigma-70 family)
MLSELTRVGLDVDEWLARLQSGDKDGAWTLFLARYHRLIGATIARCTPDTEDAHDVFAHVCERLSTEDLARLRRFQEAPAHRAKFSTWLVVVVRNLAVDWLRARDGRPRASPPPGLSAMRQRIYQVVLVERRSHAEAYETLRGEEGCDCTFSQFLQEVAATYGAVDSRRWSFLARAATHAPEAVETSNDESDNLERDEERRLLAAALAGLTAAERAALQLFVVEERPANEVAQTLGWANSKAVYNKVHRALASLRVTLTGPTRRVPPE